MNVVLQALIQIPPLRNYMLTLRPKPRHNDLVKEFGVFVRKMWSPKMFRPHVSPHEIAQTISNLSKKRFTVGKRSDPRDFLLWFLNTLHSGLVHNKTSIVHKAFQGEMHITTTRKVLKKGTTEQSADMDEGNDDQNGEKKKKKRQFETVVEESNQSFLYLPLDVPSVPLFKDEEQKNIIPKVPITDCLQKYSGLTEQTQRDGSKRKYVITRLPRFLIMHMKRFTENYYGDHKNSTIVHAPIQGLDLSEYCQLKERQSTVYRLVSSIRHNGSKANEGSYIADVYHRGLCEWYEIDDLEVQKSTQVLDVSEAYLQIWEQVPRHGLLGRF
mmetsp:Transcript_18563/g.47184  ORF Transcript_18563/g.47184 Transcript_18563/m.47184 type:complete len:327 (-) Transcript_18563:21-1001(-)